jgi:methionyl-tRNA synthetase
MIRSPFHHRRTNLPENILVTSGWPYVNGEPHLGHVAGTLLPADIFARYQRLAGNNVLMVSGSDMHGTPTALVAQELGVSPESVATKNHQAFVEAIEKFEISFDLYTRTNTDVHAEVTQGLFSSILKNGYLYEATQQMPFCLEEQRFLSDRFVEGVCPYCSYEKAGGDQCDNCGKTLDPSDLGGIRCTVDGSTPEFRETSHYIFKLSAMTERLLEWVEPQDHLRIQVRNMILAMLRDGLPDRAITRDIEWGVPLPEGIEGYENKRIYVWFEAVIGYLSASIAWARSTDNPDAWKDWWHNRSARTFYFVGKDNTTFHMIFWPAILMARGGDPPLNLPTDVPANEFLNYEGGAFSKSRNWGIGALEALDRYDADALRYYLSATMPETSDTDFRWASFLSRNNDELVATLGNFIHRVLSMIARNFDGAAPARGETDEVDNAAIAECDAAMEGVGEQLEGRHFREALRLVMALAQHGNRYLDAKQPWQTAKTDMDRTGTTLSVGLEIVAALRTLMAPFLPQSARKLHGLLGANGDMQDNGWTRPTPEPGQPLPKPTPLFKKLDPTVVEEELDRHGDQEAPNN